MRPDYYSPEPLINIDELCQILQCGRGSAYKLLKSGKIKSLRIGKNYKIPRRAVQEYILAQSNLSLSIW